MFLWWFKVRTPHYGQLESGLLTGSCQTVASPHNPSAQRGNCDFMNHILKKMQSAKGKHQQGFYLFIGNSQRSALVMMQFINSHVNSGLWLTATAGLCWRHVTSVSPMMLEVIRLRACVCMNTSFISELRQLKCSLEVVSTRGCCEASVTAAGRAQRCENNTVRGAMFPTGGNWSLIFKTLMNLLIPFYHRE